jgi:hypothetical protein
MSLSVFGQKQIATAEELQAIGNDAASLRGQYILTNDIEVDNWTPIGNINAHFTGVFDGNGHTITIRSIANTAPVTYRVKSSMKIQGTEACFIGLFGSTGRRSLVRNVRVAGEIHFEGDAHVVTGGIAGINFGQILNCITDAALNAQTSAEGDCFAGGIAGINNGVIRNCYTTGDVGASGSVNSYAGGVTGVNDFDAGVIQFCHAAGDVAVQSGSRDRIAGGIAGICAKGGVVQYSVAFSSAVSAGFSDADNSRHLTGRITGKNFGRIGGNYSYRDMTLALDQTRDNDRSLQTLTALQDRLWWERYARYAFGNNGARPWKWNEETQRPALYWENGEAIAALPSQKPREAQQAEPRSREREPRQANAVPRNQVKEIHTVEELLAVGQNPSALQGSYILMNDLTLDNWTPIGITGDREAFTGTFDGNGHTLTLSSLAEGQNRRFCLYGGVFGEIGKRGVVRNLRVAGELEFSSDEKSMYIGGIAAENNGLIECCISELNITADGGQYTAGNKWAALGKAAAVSSATNRTVVAFYEWGVYAGDIVGVNLGTVRNCYATGNLHISGKGYKSAGGIAGGTGSSSGGVTVNCYATGNITAVGDGASRFVGGIAGMNGHVIESCVALNEELTARGQSGGFAPSGASLEWNINIALGIAGRDVNREINHACYRSDMTLNREDADGNSQKKSFGEKFQKKGKEIAPEETESREWWLSIGRKYRFLFDGDNPSAPWVWDDTQKRPTLYWEIK